MVVTSLNYYFVEIKHIGVFFCFFKWILRTEILMHFIKEHEYIPKGFPLKTCSTTNLVSVSSQVLATGLSALYSSLPRKIEVRGDDWHALRREDWIGVSSLVLFMNSLEFCNAVVQVAHPLVRSQLLDYLHNGFLVPVMGPALHKVGRICGRDVIKFGLCNHRLRAFD